jgi:hypothetical protein
VVCETQQRGSNIDFIESFSVIRVFSGFVKSLYPGQIQAHHKDEKYVGLTRFRMRMFVTMIQDIEAFLRHQDPGNSFDLLEEAWPAKRPALHSPLSPAPPAYPGSFLQVLEKWTHESSTSAEDLHLQLVPVRRGKVHRLCQVFLTS